MSEGFQRDNINCCVLQIQILRYNPTELHKEFVRRQIPKSSSIVNQNHKMIFLPPPERQVFRYLVGIKGMG